MLKVVLLLFVITVGAYDPPDPKKLIEVFEVNLDLPPEKRWTKIIQEKEKALRLLLGILKPEFIKHKVTFDLIAGCNASMPQEYIREMQGIADAVANITFEDVLMANLFYEITGVADTPFDLSRSCTSIVAQHANGTVFLARNQDYPPPFTLVMIHAIFTKGGKKVYEGTTYAGTIGLSTAAVPGGWAVSINARSNSLCSKDRDECQKKAVASAASGGAIFPIFTRQTIDTIGSNYDDAVDYMTSRPLIMPGYMIAGGVAPNQGAILTRDPFGSTTNALHLYDHKTHDEGGGEWYVVQTNTDHWVHKGNSSRRATATHGLDKIGKDSIDLLGLWNVLSTPPTYNQATIHTDLVGSAWGEYRTYKRHGPLID